MKVIIFGGSGFLGQQIAKILVQRQHQVISVSRHGKPATLSASWSHQVQWVCSDVTRDTNWQEQVQRADWVIDTVGILFENPRKKKTYQRLILTPVKKISSFLAQQKKPAKFLFISANTVPFPLRKYMEAKLAAEELIHQEVAEAVIFYPSLLVGQERIGTILFSKCIYFFKKISFLKNLFIGYDPVPVAEMAQEIVHVLEGGNSIYTHRRTR